MPNPPTPTRLSPEQSERLVQLLALALNFDQLDNYVYLGTGDRLYVEFIGQGKPLKPLLRDLIQALELGPITDKFLRVVYREKPLQFELRALIAGIYPDIPATAAREPLYCDFQQAGAPLSPPSGGPGLQRIVKPKLPFLNIQVWLDRFETIKRQVCRVEVDQAGIGTGFLVGPDAVLTNWHVVREARRRGAADKLACRFDYRRLTDNTVDPGTLLPVTAVLDERPCSAAELTANPDDPAPQPGELDYALLHLSSPTPDRGALRLVDPPPAGAGASLIIVQHPEGDPLRFAIDTDAVQGLVHDGLRLRYATNTAPGSSGSPCFDLDWNLLALHHLGDPRAGPVTFNQGIPIGLIRASVAERGFAAALVA